MDDLASRSVISIRTERWGSLWPDCAPLMKDHKAELGQNDPRRALDPDHERILALEAAGGLLCLVARDYAQRKLGAAALVGYLVWFLFPSLETKGLLCAQQSAWYVKPSWRKSRVGTMLWEESLGEMRRRGIVLVLPHAPAGGEALLRWLAGRGARAIETSCEMWLGDLV